MRRPRRDADDPAAALNLTPTIDVVFLLLIFFIATIRLPEPEANIRAFLPKTEHKEGTGGREKEDEEDIERITVKLERHPSSVYRIIYEGNVLPGGFDHLRGVLALKRRSAQYTPEVEQEILLDADSSIPYRVVIRALDVCSSQGFDNVSFAMPKDVMTPGNP